jgi:protein SCO1
MRMWLVRLLALLLLVLSISDAQLGAAETELPLNSYYQLDVALETHKGDYLRLAELQGSPVIVTMFYQSCAHVCPMTISTMKAIEAKLAPEDLLRLRVLMITFDPERDTPTALSELADRHGVDQDRWRFARTKRDDARLIAAVLGVKYRKLPDGGFNHSSPLILLDASGREISRSEKLGLPDMAFVNSVAAVVAD